MALTPTKNSLKTGSQIRAYREGQLTIRITRRYYSLADKRISFYYSSYNKDLFVIYVLSYCPILLRGTNHLFSYQKNQASTCIPQSVVST
jgi:hypothetical protein